jgi:hypothetical protein
VFELYLFDIRMLELTFLLDVHLIYKFNDKERLWFLQKQKKNNFLGLGPFCNQTKKKERTILIGEKQQWGWFSMKTD